MSGNALSRFLKGFRSGFGSGVKEKAASPERPPKDAARIQSQIGNRFGKEMIVGKGVHYSKLFLSPEMFPTVTEEGKPPNDMFKQVKTAYVENAFAVVKRHYEYVSGLKGMKSDKLAQKAVQHVLKLFIQQFWDMPASASDHHAHPWGLLIHSLSVACAKAEKAEAINRLTDYGLDAQNQERDKGKLIAAHFFAGLFHDSHKVLDYKLTAYKPNRIIEYSPQRGGVLNFKLLFGRKSLVEDWDHQGNAERNTHFCYMFLFGMVPPEFFRSVESIDTFKAAILEVGKTGSGQLEEDHQDASSGITIDTQHRCLVELYQAISNYIAKQDGSDYGLWRLDENWFVFDEITFLRGVKSETEYFPTPQSILYALDNLGGLPCKILAGGAPQYSERHQGIILPCLRNGHASLENGTILPNKRPLCLLEKSVMDEILNHLVTSIGLVPEFPRIVIDLRGQKEAWIKETLLMSVTPAISDVAFLLEQDGDDEDVGSPSMPEENRSREPEDAAAHLQQMPSAGQTFGEMAKEKDGRAQNNSQKEAKSKEEPGRQNDESRRSDVSNDETVPESNGGVPQVVVETMAGQDTVQPASSQIIHDSEEQRGGDAQADTQPEQTLRRKAEELLADIEREKAQPPLSGQKTHDRERDVESKTANKQPASPAPDQLIDDDGLEMDPEQIMDRLYDYLNDPKKTPLNEPGRKLFLYIQNDHCPSRDDHILVKGQVLLKALDLKLKGIETEEKDMIIHKIVGTLKKKGLVAMDGILDPQGAEFEKFDDPTGENKYEVGSAIYFKLNYDSALEKVRQIREYLSLRQIDEIEEV